MATLDRMEPVGCGRNDQPFQQYLCAHHVCMYMYMYVTHLGGRCSDQGGIDGASCLTERNRDIPTVTMVTIVTMVTTITMVTNVVVVTRLNPLI